MVCEFENIEELENAIIEDKKNNSISTQRFPIRFIFLNSHDELKNIVNLLNKHDAERIELDKLLYSKNSWFSDDQLINEVKKINKTSLIVPLSEYIRFSNDENFKRIISSLSEIENNKIKIYIPLIGLWSRFKNLFWNDYYRKDNWAPIWKLNTKPKKIKIYQINFDLNQPIKQNNMDLISNTEEWFNLWKKDNVENIISLPKPLSIFFKNSLPDQTFYREIINNPKDYLKKIIGMDINIEYNPKEKEHWNKIMTNVIDKNNNYNNLVEYFNDEFNKNNALKMDEIEYIDLYLENSNDKYKQWIIKNFFLQTEKYKNSYLNRCFKSLENSYSKNIIKKIFLEIFDIENPEQYLNERKKLLEYFKNKKIKISDDGFENKYKNIENLDYKQQLKFLTTSTQSEKQKIINIVRKNGIENTINEVKEIYPELGYYLDWNINLESTDSWIIDYFKEYNESKILNQKSDKLTNLLNEKNNPQKLFDWYYNAKKSEYKEENTYTVWIDGLGAEWTPLFINLLNKYGKEYGKEVIYKSINSVNLPSSTKFNKQEHDEKISILDKYIHDNYYVYPNSLVDEIELIKEMVKEIVSIDSPRISIVSDHGFSFLCTRKFGCIKKYECEDAKHGGRYALCEKKGEDNEDYVYIETESEDFNKEVYKVASKHSSLHNTPAYEVHGGATPEELLIPHIIIENNENIIDYTVSSPISKINITNELKLPIDITPYPNTTPIAIYNNKMLNVSEENDKYYINLNHDIEKGEQKIEIKINDKPVGELKINIEKGGMQSNDDDWF